MKKQFFIFLSLIAAYQSGAQYSLVNFGNLQIHTGAEINLSVNFTNESTAEFINNGSLYLKGNISNSQPSMFPGTGIIYLIGESIQQITGIETFATNHLTTNNNTGFILNNDLSISGTHLFSAGVITTSASPNYLIYLPGSDYSGNGDTKHVNGWVKKIGSEDFIFPVGTASIERPVELKNLSAMSEFNVSYNPSTVNYNNVQTPLLYADQYESWNILKDAGGTASVMLNWDHNKVSFPNLSISDIRVADYDGFTWVSAGGLASGDVTNTGLITSNTIASFNKFTFGSEGNILPLSLISFTAKYFSNFTQLNWTTVNEQHVDFFKIKRSDNGNDFYPILHSPARNSTNREIYSDRDHKKIDKIAYYRLHSVDLDGSETLSSIVLVAVPMTNKLNLVTNLVNDKLILSANQNQGSFAYSINSMNGQLVQNGKISISTGLMYLPLNDLQKGTYSLRLINTMQSYQFTFIVH